MVPASWIACRGVRLSPASLYNSHSNWILLTIRANAVNYLAFDVIADLAFGKPFGMSSVKGGKKIFHPEAPCDIS